MQPILKSLHMLTIPKINHHHHHYSLRNFNVWASAIRNASSPQEALYLYTQQLQQQHQQQREYSSHSILFTLNSIARSPKPNLTIISHLHAHILKIGFDSHVYVATSLLHSYVVCSFKDARLLFDEMPERNAVTFNTMITGYSKLGDLRNAHLLFNGMIIKDIGSWSAMIAGYMSSNNWEEGLMLFREMMMKESLKPDQMMLVSVLSGCTHMGSLGLLMGKSIHCFVQKNGWELSVELGTVLIDMYTKCGFVESAFRVFEKMRERNVMSWSAMICGFAQHGNGEKALTMFQKMKESGVRPNEVTFTGVLSACTHAGLIDQGLEYFSSMVNEYSLEPRIQHYGCMVDLLGKAGKLDEAFELIRTMKLEPNVIVWGSLLAACKVHKRFEMAERVIDRVLKVAKPEENGGVYTLISDLYALNGKWEEAQKVRELMVSQKVKKARGSSFIRTGNTTGTTQTVL